MSSKWWESSKSEILLARAIAQRLDSEDLSMSMLSQVMEDLASYLTKWNTGTSLSTKTASTIEMLKQEFPELAKVNVSKPFPETADDLTANFFNRLAYEVNVRKKDPILQGAVGTPAILTQDMVALAATVWLTMRVNIPEPDLRSIVFGTKAASLTEANIIRSALQQATWYDPCIGGGVFPVAIILLLDQFNIQLDQRQLQQILGRDIDPLSVTASYIRVALAVSFILKKPYTTVRQELPCMFTVDDSLEYFPEQSSHSLEQLNIFEEHIQTDKEQQVDIIVANPPYVRANRISPQKKFFIKKAYPSISGGMVDLYNYFLAHGLVALKHSGVLCYVSPASFQKSKYGENTRKYIRQHGNVQVIFDFNELPVFDNAGVHASVYAIAKETPQSSANAYAFTSLPQELPLLFGLTHTSSIPAFNIGIKGWHITHTPFETILDILSKDTVPLISYVGHIFSGIKTGHSKAFYVSQAKAGILTKEEETAKFLKPLLLPVDIRTWQTSWQGTHLIYIRKGEVVSPETLLMQHLHEYESALRNRSDIKGHPTWYGLRECSYEHVFTQPKIVFPDIAVDCRFAMDTKGFFIPDGAFIIPKADYLLLGLLNSCIGRFYFRAFCNSIGNPSDGGRLRFKKTYVERFPVPKLLNETASLRNKIEQLACSLTGNHSVKEAADYMDELVLEIYDIPQEYWNLVRGGC